MRDPKTFHKTKKDQGIFFSTKDDPNQPVQFKGKHVRSIKKFDFC
jgi:hypothetical protein